MVYFKILERYLNEKQRGKDSGEIRTLKKKKAELKLYSCFACGGILQFWTEGKRMMSGIKI